MDHVFLYNKIYGYTIFYFCIKLDQVYYIIIIIYTLQCIHCDCIHFSCYLVTLRPVLRVTIISMDNLCYDNGLLPQYRTIVFIVYYFHQPLLQHNHLTSTSRGYLIYNHDYGYQSTQCVRINKDALSFVVHLLLV